MAQVAGHVVGRDEELGSLARILDEFDLGRSRALARVVDDTPGAIWSALQTRCSSSAARGRRQALTPNHPLSRHPCRGQLNTEGKRASASAGPATDVTVVA